MKPFNLEKYLANPSKKVITRDGRNVTIHCTNFNSCQPIIAQIEGHNSSHSFTKDGKYFIDNRNSSYDLFFVSEKKEGWINLYKMNSIIGTGPRAYDTKEEAESAAGDKPYYYISTIKIEWEE